MPALPRRKLPPRSTGLPADDLLLTIETFSSAYSAVAALNGARCKPRNLSSHVPVKPRNSPVRSNYFPVSLRREFSCKPLYSLGDWTPNRRGDRNRRNSLYFPWLAGNFDWRLVRSGL